MTSGLCVWHRVTRHDVIWRDYVICVTQSYDVIWLWRDYMICMTQSHDMTVMWCVYGVHLHMMWLCILCDSVTSLDMTMTSCVDLVHLHVTWLWHDVFIVFIFIWRDYVFCVTQSHDMTWPWRDVFIFVHLHMTWLCYMCDSVISHHMTSWLLWHDMICSYHTWDRWVNILCNMIVCNAPYFLCIADFREF